MEQGKPHTDNFFLHLLEAGKSQGTQTIFRHVECVGFLLYTGHILTGIENVHGGLALAPLCITVSTMNHFLFQAFPGRSFLGHDSRHSSGLDIGVGVMQIAVKDAVLDDGELLMIL